MGTEVLTMSFIIMIVFLIQSGALLILYQTNRKYRGVFLWFLGCICFSLGFLSICFRSYPLLNILSVFTSNLFYIAGLLFLHVGSLRFIERKVNYYLLALFFSLFSFSIVYFTVIDNNVNARIATFSLASALILFFTAFLIVRTDLKSIQKTVKGISILFFTTSALMVLRAVSSLWLYPVQSFLEPSLLQVLTMILSLFFGLSWTFALIIMVNQRISAEMNEAKNQFELIFNTIPDPVIITSIADGKIIDTNEGFSILTGYSKEEAKGKSSLELNLWNNFDERVKIIDAIQEKGVCNNLEILFKSKEDKILTGLYSAKIIVINGLPYMISIIRDITDKKLMDQELRLKNLQLEATNAEKDKFFSIIAHDLRSPFNSFMGLTEVIAEDLDTMSSEMIRKMVESINVTAKGIYALLENLLQWSRINRGAISFNPQELNVSSEVMKVTSTTMTLARHKSIDLIIDIENELKVTADSYMFQSILRNLLSNAIKFTNRKGTIILNASKKEDAVFFSISDNGIGIRNELIGELFHFKANTGRSGTEGESSSGIGLFLCKEFVDRHNGKIWAESKEGEGSVFYFSLPVPSAIG
ncbi:MAG TPA: PAS domain-containing sensor histidine kinase [Prolixibacteraceae bacterium]|nr:PAS domain-containing sensor histidine kinase [Prolixibacteraceae bacterium]HPS12925.1 PAS domain-containing sensor histidine kinase [Prolixibacteraceae bacterium]